MCVCVCVFLDITYSSTCRHQGFLLHILHLSSCCGSRNPQLPRDGSVLGGREQWHGGCGAGRGPRNAHLLSDSTLVALAYSKGKCCFYGKTIGKP